MTKRELRKLLEEISGLPADRLERLRAWLSSSASKPVPKDDDLFGSLSNEDAHAMTLAIGEAFERVETDGGPAGQQRLHPLPQRRPRRPRPFRP